MKISEKYKTALEKGGINTPLRLAHFMAQIDHESGFKPIIENLHYTSARLKVVFPKYFQSISLCNAYSNKPENISNRVYANRMGNGDESSGDGWKYRGRGFLQITGKENYQNLAKATGLDCFKNPDILLEKEANAMVSAIWFWNLKGLNKYADIDDIVSITKRINGGTNGLEHRTELLLRWKNLV